MCGLVVNSASRMTPRSLTALLGLMALEPTVIYLSMMARLARSDGLPNHVSSIFASFSCRRRADEIGSAVVQATTHIVDIAERRVSVYACLPSRRDDDWHRGDRRRVSLLSHVLGVDVDVESVLAQAERLFASFSNFYYTKQYQIRLNLLLKPHYDSQFREFALENRIGLLFLDAANAYQVLF